jgi:acyl-coenzyme A synthetase/AMP-(fatty) acid ligase
MSLFHNQNGSALTPAVPPAELEALLLTHSKVADAAVIGVYSDKMATELPRAYIVPAQNLGPLAKMSDKRRTAISHEVFEYVKDKAANHKWLRGGVMLVESIPKSPSGKILRKDLRALVKEEAAVQATRSAKL